MLACVSERLDCMRSNLQKLTTAAINSIQFAFGWISILDIFLFKMIFKLSICVCNRINSSKYVVGVNKFFFSLSFPKWKIRKEEFIGKFHLWITIPKKNVQRHNLSRRLSNIFSVKRRRIQLGRFNTENLGKIF